MLRTDEDFELVKNALRIPRVIRRLIPSLILLVGLFVSVPTSLNATSFGSLDFQGGMTYQISGNSVHMTINRIVNDSSTYTSGSLRVELWASSSPYKGGSLSGYKTASIRTSQLTGLSDQLEPNSSFSDITLDLSYKAPPPGNTSYILLLTEFDSSCTSNDHFCITAYLNLSFTATFTITGTVVDRNGLHIAGATITLTGGGKTYTAITDSNGTFRLAFDPGGMLSTVAFTVTKTGYTPLASQLTIGTGSSKDVGLLTMDPESRGVTYSLNDLGGRWMGTSTNATNPTVGYGLIQANSGQSLPAGIAIYAQRQNGILINELVVPASRLIRSGRIYAEVDGVVNTGLAIANPNEESVSIDFVFYDSLGRKIVKTGTTSIPPKGQIAKFLTDDPFNGPSRLEGTLTFTASAPVGALAITGFTNQRSEFLMSSLPVSEVPTSIMEPLYISQFADGGGWKTQLLLVNPTDTTITGRTRWFNESGTSVAINLTSPFCTNCSGASFTYSIPPGSAFMVRTSGSSQNSISGRIAIEPDAGMPVPAANAIYSFTSPEGVTSSEAGVDGIPAKQAFRMYAELSTGIESAIALASASNITVDLSLTTTSGAPSGFTGRLSIPANGRVSKFLTDIPGFENVPRPFRGVLRMSGPCCFTALGVRTRTNERGELLIATTQPIPEDATPPTSQMLFPQLAVGGDYNMEFILFSGAQGKTVSGKLQFYTQQGSALDLNLSTWQELESVTQTIQAAQGGTITLPGGSFVTIPPGTLKNDQPVRVTLLSSMPREVPSGLLKSVGPALSVTFPKGAANPAFGTRLSNEKRDGKASTGTETIPAIQFNIITSSLPTDPASYIQLGDIEPPQARVQYNMGVFSALTKPDIGTAAMPASMVNYLSQGAEDSSFTVNVGNVTWNPSLPRYPAKSSSRMWDPALKKWLAMDSPTVSLKRGVKTCVVVHGMMSSVEKAYREDSNCVDKIGTANGCEQVLGFNYDWTRGINESGAQLAAFLDKLAASGISDVVLEAHSEGGPVSVAALAQTESKIVKNLVTLGSPLTGTPAADRGTDMAIAALLAYNEVGKTCAAVLGASVPDIPVRQAVEKALPFLVDLTTASGATGTLAQAREILNRKHPETQVTAIAGTGGSLLPKFLTTALFGPSGTVIDPNSKLMRAIWNGWIFGDQQQDSIVNGSSALGQNSGLNIKTALTFALEHTGLECDDRVINAVGKSVNAGGTPPPPPPPSASYTLTVVIGGSGSGTVSANPPGLYYMAGTSVTLTARPDSQSTFASWGSASGVCSGTQLTCTLTVNADDIITANFNAQAPAVSLSATSLNFGTVTVGTASGAQSVTLTNSGGAALSITRIALGTGSSGDFKVTQNCPLTPSTLAPAASCTITVTLTPSATGGRSATIDITDNAPGSPQTISLTGAGGSSGGGGSLIGTWVGTWTHRPNGICSFVTNSLTWNLTQSGSSVSGTFVSVVTAIDPDGLCGDAVGDTTRGSLVQGTVNGSHLSIYQDGGFGFSGTFTATTISGTGGSWNRAMTTCGASCGPFTLTKR